MIHIEELHKEERKDLEEKESRMAKLDFDGFEKELKGTLKERKKANRVMSKDEVPHPLFLHSACLQPQAHLSLLGLAD